MSTSSRPTVRSLGHLVFGFAVVAVVAGASPAQASPSYPAKLEELLNMECAAPCTVCHLDVNGGAGTAEKAFGKAMIDQGLAGEDDALIKPALDALEAAGSDSDGDGVSDVEELRASTDPNVAGDKPVCGPRYGCGARVAPRGPVDAPALALALFAALALLAARRRR